MLKKITLGIVALALLMGAENLLAKEKADKPKAKQKQAQKLQQKRKGQAKQLQKQKAAKETGHRHGMPRQVRPGRNRPAPQMFDRWLNTLTKAYRENDREKMGRILRKMNKARQSLKKQRAVLSSPRRKLRHKPWAGGKSMWLRGGSGRPNRGFKANRFGGWQGQIIRGRRGGRFGRHRWIRPRRCFGW